MRIALVAWLGMPHTGRFAAFYAGRGHEVHVLTCGDAPAVARGLPYEVHDLGLPVGGKPGYVAKIPRARRLLATLRPDVVHAHTATSYGLIALAAGGQPLVVTTHGSDVLLSPRNVLMRQIVRRVLLGADLVTAPAEHMRIAIDEITGGRAREVIVFQYGVEADRLAALGSTVRSERDDDDPPRLVTARPLTPLYRTDSILRAMRLLGGEWELDVAGDGPERSRLEALAVDLGVSARVTFHGLIDELAVQRLIARADAYLSMAESDGVSIALLEALALGTVPVVVDIEPNRAWVDDGVNGALTAPTPESIAQAVSRARAIEITRARELSYDRVRSRADRTTNLAELLRKFELLRR